MQRTEVTTPTCPHNQPPKLSYIGGQTDADKRLERGERQLQCPVCELWIWEEYWYDKKTRHTKRRRS